MDSALKTPSVRPTFPLDDKGRPLVSVLSIEAVDRVRQVKPNLTGLMASIEEVGLIHAITLADEPLPNGNYRILAGECRWQSHLNLLAEGKKKFAVIPVCFESQVDALSAAMVEGHENIHRNDFSMVEYAEMTALIDELKRKKFGEATRGSEVGWSNKKTAELRGVSPATVSLQKQLVEELKKDPSLREEIIKRGMPLQPALKFIEQKKEQKRTAEAVASGAVILSSDLQLGDARKLILDVDSESIGCILSDPPFGNIQIATEAGESRGTTQSYLGQLEESDNLTPDKVGELFLSLAPQFWRVLKPGGHFYFFYSHSIRHIVANCLRTAGLSIIEPDLIWDKGRNMNAFSGYNWMSRYEPVLFGYKPGPKDYMKRLAEPRCNIIECAPLPSDSKVHSFQKPEELLSIFIKQSTSLGDIVLDPFAGSGSTIKTARLLGRSGLGFELSQKNYTSAQNYIKEDSK